MDVIVRGAHVFEQFPIVDVGSDLVDLIVSEADRCMAAGLSEGDVVVVACKLVSIVEQRRVRWSDVHPSAEAVALSEELEPVRDPRMVELAIRESRERGIVHLASPRLGNPRGLPQSGGTERYSLLTGIHRRGYGPLAFSGVDRDLLKAEADGREYGEAPFLLLPEDCDASAGRIRNGLRDRTLVQNIGVVIADSEQWPDRAGSVAVALGSAGIAPQRRTVMGAFGVETAESIVDLLANAAAIVMGQLDRGVPVALIRGVRFDPSENLGVLDMIRGADKLEVEP